MTVTGYRPVWIVLRGLSDNERTVHTILSLESCMGVPPVATSWVGNKVVSEPLTRQDGALSDTWHTIGPGTRVDHTAAPLLRLPGTGGGIIVSGVSVTMHVEPVPVDTGGDGGQLVVDHHLHRVPMAHHYPWPCNWSMIYNAVF